MSWFRPRARLLAFAAICAGFVPTAAPAVEPITIGFDIELTGGIAPLGKASLLAIQIWTEEINARGGLLSRPVKLIFYDDQSNPALVPGIVTKLLDVDKVDLLLGEVGTNMIAPAMPMVMERHLTFISLFGNDVNSNFHYQNYFSMNPVGGETPRNALSQGFFAVAEMMNPKPQTVALVGADAEFGKNALEGARANAKQAGLKIVYDQTYPPATTDYSPIVRSIQGTNPDLVYVGAYPPDSVGMVRAANEIGLRTRMFGGSMVGLWSTAIKMQLGPLLNGIVNFDTWQPVKSLATPEALAFLQKYQARAVAAGVDPLGYSVPPFAYSSDAGARPGDRGRREPRPDQSWLTICAATRSTQWPAASRSGRTANGPSRACLRSSSRAWWGMTWTNSRIRRPRSFCGHPPCKPVPSAIPTPKRNTEPKGMSGLQVDRACRPGTPRSGRLVTFGLANVFTASKYGARFMCRH